MEQGPEYHAELLRKAKAGDQAARDELFELAQERVLQRVRRKMGPGLRKQIESIDVQQSVLADAFRDLPKFKGDDDRALWAWLGQMVENKLRNKARDAGRLKRDGGQVVRLNETAATGSVPLEPEGSDPTPSQMLSANDELERLKAAVAKLPDHWREVFELRVVEGLGWPEIAERTGQTVKAAQGRFGRAQEQLAQLLG